MMSWVWGALALTAIGFSFMKMFFSSGADASSTLMRAAMDAVALCVRLAGGFAFWSGLMAILEDCGAVRGLTRALRRPLARLFPGVAMDGEAGQAMTMNLAANLLGLGNAATPMGVKAMGLLGATSDNGAATDAMCMFLVVNASSIQLYPSSVVAMRAVVGSEAPASIVLPTLAATAVSTVVGIATCALLARRGRHG
jgi:spore maturation protein A